MTDDNSEQLPEDLVKNVESMLNESQRKSYFNQLHLKERADIKIAEHYLMQCMYASMAGELPSSALNDKQTKFLYSVMKKHHTYFGGLPLIGM